MWTPGSGGGGGAGGAGDVVGPESSNDNGIPRFDGTDGTTLQDSSLRISDSPAIQWGTSANVPAINRNGAVLRVMNGTEALVFPLSARRPAQAPGTSALTEAQSRYVLTNSGASGAQTFTLPAATLPAAGAMEFMVVVTDAHDIVIQAAGSDVMYDGAAPSSAGGTLTLTGVGTSCLITCPKAGIWTTISAGNVTAA